MERESSRISTDTVIRQCPVRLTETERQEYAAQLAREVKEYDRREQEKKDETKRLGDLLKEQRGVLDDLAFKVNSGIEHRPVECSVLADARRGIIEIRRIDTGDLVDSRAMTSQEKTEHLQMSM